MKTMTVNDLMTACYHQAQKGNGNKKVLVSSDDEGNSFHELFFSFTEKMELRPYQLPHGVNDKNIREYIVLG